MQIVGLKAYNTALSNFSKVDQQSKANFTSSVSTAKEPANDFSQVLSSSLEKVNGLQSERSAMITSFASGENQNVHELMISMQKAGLAMNMTAAVRNKVMEAYKELSRMQF
jgi:flagellar hook-basal body complex protein FliE